MRRHLAGPVAVAATLAAASTFGIGSPRTASAGGFDIPDQGTESLGRGGAFVAKSDSPLALYNNVASLAKMRGTRLLVDVNLVFQT